MNADQLAEILPALRELTTAPPDTCLTFEVEDAPGKWLQVTGLTINAAYPHTDHPQDRLDTLDLPPLSTELASWEPGTYATFDIPQIDIDPIAAWIDAYFVQVLHCPIGDYHLDITFETM